MASLGGNAMVVHIATIINDNIVPCDDDKVMIRDEDVAGLTAVIYRFESARILSG